MQKHLTAQISPEVLETNYNAATVLKVPIEVNVQLREPILS